MTIQETLKSFIQKYKEKKQNIKNFESNEHMIDRFNQKKLSHDERVLNKLMEQNRQGQIKKDLEFELVRRRNEDKQKARNMFSSNNKLWTDNSLMKCKNVFQNNKSILKCNKL